MTHSLMTTDPAAVADFKSAVSAYLAHLVNDYRRWDKTPADAPLPAWAKANFSLVGDGKLYAKVINADANGTSRSAHSFIVLSDTGKFKRGDILKAASWKAPAKNFRRGNVFNPASYAGASWAGL
jgi:hypothetical protein